MPDEKVKALAKAAVSNEIKEITVEEWGGTQDSEIMGTLS
jgi:hypothetical protein